MRRTAFFLGFILLLTAPSTAEQSLASPPLAAQESPAALLGAQESLAAAPLAAQESPAAQGRAFTPQDWYRLTTLSSPAMSPDGRHVAFTVTTVKEADNARHSEVWMVSTEGGDPTRLTSPGTVSSSRWTSPSKGRDPMTARSWFGPRRPRARRRAKKRERGPGAPVGG
jgi:hypothetical protein